MRALLQLGSWQMQQRAMTPDPLDDETISRVLQTYASATRCD